jgi:hypothetical protein
MLAYSLSRECVYRVVAQQRVYMSKFKKNTTLNFFICVSCNSRNDNDNDKPIKSLLKGKGLLPPVGLARLDS